MIDAIDPKLKDYAPESVKLKVDAVNSHGGSYADAALALGIRSDTLYKAIKDLKAKAARLGYAPGNWKSGVAPGYLMGKVTVHRDFRKDPEGRIVQTWERQSPEWKDMLEAARAAAEALAEELPRAEPNRGPSPAANLKRNLLNLYTLTDCHVGMLAWRKEGGADWDLKIAEETLIKVFIRMIDAAPGAWTCVISQLGDFLHSDGLLPITPTSGHILDQDGRFSKMVKVAVRVLRAVCDYALSKHEEVIVLMAEGNHDMASSVWLRIMFAALYENEPRLKVVDSELPYYAVQHGQTMLAFHHGHLKKPDQFPLVFAAQYPTIWGATTKRYAHAGHQHHLYEKEHGGMRVMQHPTLAARDAYAARGAWFAERAAYAITYHDEYGEVGRVTVTPEMV